MNINGRHHTTIWLNKNSSTEVEIIDQRFLPFQLHIETLRTPEEVYIAIKDMHLRGAPLIGVAGAFGMYLALLQAPEHNDEAFLDKAAIRLMAARPTAVNLEYAVTIMRDRLRTPMTRPEKTDAALSLAQRLG